MAKSESFQNEKKRVLNKYVAKWNEQAEKVSKRTTGDPTTGLLYPVKVKLAQWTLMVWHAIVSHILGLAVTAQSMRHRYLFMPINSANPAEQVQSLQNADEDLKKAMPRHLCLAFMEDALNYEDICRISSWCIALGVKYLTFYDYTGRLLASPNILEEEMEKKMFECRMSKEQVSFVQPGEQPTKADIESEATLARMIDVRDGQDKVGDVIANILNDAIAMTTDGKSELVTANNDALVKEIEAQLSVAGSSFPDPECVIIFSPVEATMGLLPWQLNHSEIIRVPTHHGILPSQFLQALERYCKIEKRFGR